MDKFIYLKEVQDYEEILKFRRLKVFKKIIFFLKNKFNIITKKKIDSINIWYLPFKGEVKKRKLEKILRNQIKMKNINKNTKLVLSNNLKKKEILDILIKYNIKYVNGNLAKKQLIFKVLEYINKLQDKKLNEREITILVNQKTEVNINMITRFAFESKSIKIVSKNINMFKNLEEKLYNENGIAIQFSNSYKKSLKKSDIIINLDFSEVEINEYQINSKAIIINIEEKLKIKAKYFNGIIINSYNIDYKKTLKEFKNIIKQLKEFNNLDIYESISDSINKHFINENNTKILNLIGNNGIILDDEFKNIS